MPGLSLPGDHAERFALNDELHARPPEPLVAPLRLSFLALHAEPEERERQGDEVADLARRFGVEPPPVGANHFSAELGAFRVIWERHTEFSRYSFIVPGAPEDPFDEPALDLVPRDWLVGLTGEVMVAAHVAFLQGTSDVFDHDAVAKRHFEGNILVGGAAAGGAAMAVTDFRIHGDGFSRFVVEDHGLTQRQAGRLIQRLLEIDTYRMMALLALPVARELGRALNESERELASITNALVDAKAEDEPELLDRLTGLEAAIESRYTENLFRFGASSAYYALVQRRVVELREQRVVGLQTIQEFLERRLTPAMNTCQAIAARQESLSVRVSRASQLLSTRVEITREGQSQALLASMDRRAKLQLRLQETVEGLSVAAVTYYVSALVGRIAGGLEVYGLPVHGELIEAASVPVVALMTWLGVRRTRRLVAREA